MLLSRFVPSSVVAMLVMAFMPAFIFDGVLLARKLSAGGGDAGRAQPGEAICGRDGTGHR